MSFYFKYFHRSECKNRFVELIPIWLGQGLDDDDDNYDVMLM